MSGGISTGTNPNWRTDAGLPPIPKCECGHSQDDHPDVQEGRGCHATLFENYGPWKPGPCRTCFCRKFQKKAP